MFKLSSNITIKSTNGTLRFDYVTSVGVTTSIETLTDIATVRFPKKLSWKDKSLKDIIKIGDSITIELGYEGNNDKVFDGYIRKVGNGIPLEIECEDQMRLLKKVAVPAKLYGNLSLANLLKEFCPIPYEATDVALGKFHIQGETTLAKVLDAIRSDYSLSFFIRDGKLFGTLPTSLIGKDHGWESHYFETGTERANVNFDQLEYVTAEDVKLIIKAKNVLKDNKKIEVTEPEGATEGEVRTFFCDYAQTKDQLKVFAKEKLKTFKVDQMKGSITTMGRPLVKKGDAIKLYDKRNPEWKNRQFLAKAVRYVFNDEGKGFAQVIELGYQLN